jgi:hypothetical protein
MPVNEMQVPDVPAAPLLGRKDHAISVSTPWIWHTGLRSLHRDPVPSYVPLARETLSRDRLLTAIYQLVCLVLN